MLTSKTFNLQYTLAYVIESLRAIVGEFGFDHTATTPGPNGGGGCIYTVVRNRALVPVCIVGQFFAREGLLRVLVTDPDRDLSFDGEPTQFSTCEPGNLLWERAAQFGVEFTPEAQRFLRRAQQVQDGSSSWGNAFNTALNEEKALIEKEAQVASDHAAMLRGTAAELGGVVHAPLAPWEVELLDGDEPAF
jgi:hypothetical protein